MTTHELKTWPVYFQAIVFNKKTFEIRKNDRNFQVGDELCLCEWDPETKAYSGARVLVRVTYLLSCPSYMTSQFGLEPGYCVMSFVTLFASYDAKDAT